MKRATVIIGVDRTGGMPTLQDAAKGARRFEKWAIRHGGFDPDNVVVFTDENDGIVEIKSIWRAIKKIVDGGTTHQLIIYFAGHGINVGYSEYWLLSDAPADAQAAVNVRSSAWIAAYSGIPHTVFISDACRTAADGAASQRITGSVIFPNEGNGGLEQPVDVFYGCTLGRPALEVRDPQSASKSFSALYTTAFLDGLMGKHSALLDWVEEEGTQIAYVRPRPLKPHLIAEVPRRLALLNLQGSPVQVPDAHIVSDAGAWIARLTEEETAGVETVLATVDARPTKPTVETVSADLMKSVIQNGVDGLKDGIPKTKSIDPARPDKAPGPISQFFDLTLKAAEPFGPLHLQTQCGFKIRGDSFASAFSLHATAEPFESGSEVIRMRDVPAPGTSVLLTFTSDVGALLPAIPGFLAALTVEDGELVDVTYEPSDNTLRWLAYTDNAEEVRALRAVAASATRNGVFRLEGEDAFSLARKMQSFKGLDPTLGIYAAYAYHELQRRELIREMSAYMAADLGARLFDIALLAGELQNTIIGAGQPPGLLSPFPLMTQGWSLLVARRISLPEPLKYLQLSLIPSVWSLFDKEGLRKIQTAIQQNHIL